MYSIQDLKIAIDEPSYFAAETNRLFHRHIYNNVKNQHKSATNIFTEEWDNLIILDACRYDIFEKFANLPGQLESRISLGSTSKEFMRANFANKKLYDTVYVSANGWYEKLRDDMNSDIYRFVHTDRDIMGGLTTKPETVTQTAIKLFEKHPNKRFIIHYMQPHQPYLGPTGESINHRNELFSTVKSDGLSDEKLQKAYCENLDLVLNEVSKLIDHVEGKTVITADHGELLGEQIGPLPIQDYGHPIGVYVDELVKVPWHIYEKGDREIMSAKHPYSDEREDLDEINQQLSDLGYKV